MNPPGTGPTREAELAEFFSDFIYDPLGFVLACFPWGVKGTHLEHESLEDWQRDRLIEIGRAAARNNFNGSDAVEPIMQATASGHGIGKSALVAMITHWIMCTRPECQGVISANSKPQLKTKTWKELVKWHEMFKETTGCDWFEVSIADLWMRHKQKKATWRVDGMAWEEKKTEAYQGLHCKHSTAFVQLDEGSIIPETIFDVVMGAMKDGEPMFFVYGNPTQNTGYFYKIFHRLRDRWSTKHVDSRECKITNKREIQREVDQHGEDSDYVRVRIRGLFPHQSADQLIASALVYQAANHNDGKSHKTDALVLGVDVAREGDDESVICPRRGFDAHSEPWQYHRGLDGNQLGGIIAEWCKLKEQAGDAVDAIFVDRGDAGSSVIDFLSLRGFPVFSVQFGATPRDTRSYLRKGAEMWCAMREWMKEGGRIPDDPVLHDQLSGRKRAYTETDRMFLEPKKVMKAEGRDSPDRADALALTFSSHIAKRQLDATGAVIQRSGVTMAKTEYNPLEEAS